MVCGLFVVVHGLLSSCGVWVLSSLFVVCRLEGTWALSLWCAGFRVRGLCSLRQAGSLVEVHELSSCGAWA